ncbi:putative deoxynucleotidyltransferase terminal-interacting protein 1 [Apostichopus japonicus]|uniref:Putative deoxynucleotidyltransferase terminal-interacting protein 1 n=1 Tax=Stichopus japonicus TaxID=307972 RepID=A0A2G8JZ00_STIJA|nr:putative deoxynucleotidyltransferase terminal-interacting protein 1 [Apostichopus japonicus]
MADLGSVTPPWTNDRFARKQSILQNSMGNPFCMTMKTFPPTKHHRITKQQGLSFKGKNGNPSFNPLPALEILRCTLQRRINKDIQKVFQYYAQFFQMAVDNMRDSFGPNAVTEDHLLMVFRNSLEAAKEIFTSQPRRTRNVHHKHSQEKFHAEKYPESHHAPEKGWEWQETSDGPAGKRQKLENDNEASVFSMRPTPTIQTRKRKGKAPSHHSDYTTDIPTTIGSSFRTRVKMESVKREGPKWNPERITDEAHFVMGARANKALGLGATRGRIYIKHPEMFKYSGDQDDKQWLFDNHLMPATGGKAYMLLLADVLDLAETDEYKGSGNLRLNDLKAFKIPDFMRVKVKRYMDLHRTDRSIPKQEQSEHSSDTEDN